MVILYSRHSKCVTLNCKQARVWGLRSKYVRSLSLPTHSSSLTLVTQTWVCLQSVAYSFVVHGNNWCGLCTCIFINLSTLSCQNKLSKGAEYMMLGGRMVTGWGGGWVCIILFEIPKKWRSYFKLQWEVSVVRSWTFSGTTLVILDCHSGECPIIIQNYSKWLITTSSLLYMIITL